MGIHCKGTRTCVFATALLMCPYTFGQNSAVSFTSSQTAVTDPQRYIGNAGAVAGFFHQNRKLDFLYFGTDYSRANPTEYLNLATNNGNGTFTAAPASTCAEGPNFATDLDGDGVWDIFCSNTDVGEQSIIQHGDGHGGFSDFFRVGSTNLVLDAVAADFNGDGRTDIAVVTEAGTLEILLNQGSRSFTLIHSYPVPAFTGTMPPVKLVAEDLNGDHKYDLVLIYGGTSARLTPYFATSGGAFTQGPTSNIGATLSFFTNAAGRDVNRDGYGDIAVTTSTGVKLMLGTASGSFVSGTTISSPGAGCPKGCLVLADFSGDGNVDLAVAGNTPPTNTSGESYVRVFAGDGNGRFAFSTEYSIPSSPEALIAGDVNGTGRLDLAVAHDTQAAFTILRNIGNGAFSSARTTLAPNAQGMVAADFNHDGKPDVAVVNAPSCAAPCNGTVSVFPGSGSTYFNPAARYSIGMHGAAIAVGDVNHDGFLDLVVSNTTAGDNSDVAVLLGTASGGFQAARNYKLGSLSQDVFLVDVNKDGKLDLIEDGGVALGKGDGSFGPLTAFPAGLVYNGNNRLTIADFNGDGNPDVAFSLTTTPDSASSVQILLGNRHGGWTVGQNFFGNDQPISFITAGTIRLGKPIDLVYSFNGINGIGNGSQVNTGVVVVPGNGDGTFADSTQSSALSNGDYVHQFFGPVAIADFNGDGKPDVGVTDPFSGQFAVAPGNGDATFGPPAVFAAANNAVGIATADFDGNKLPDVMVSGADGIARLYAQPVPTVSPGQLNFTGAAVGKTQTITIKNTLTSALSIGASIAVAPSRFAVQSSTCGGSLLAGHTCTLTIALESANGSYAPDDLIITSNGVQIDDVLLIQLP